VLLTIYGSAYILVLYGKTYIAILYALAYSVLMTQLKPQNVRTPEQIGAAIRRRRKALNWTQSELGERAGLRQATISDMERGLSGVHIKSLCDVLAALKAEIIIDDRGKASDDGIFEELF